MTFPAPIEKGNECFFTNLPWLVAPGEPKIYPDHHGFAQLMRTGGAVQASEHVRRYRAKRTLGQYCQYELHQSHGPYLSPDGHSSNVQAQLATTFLSGSIDWYVDPKGIRSKMHSILF